MDREISADASLERVEFEGVLHAIIIRSSFHKPGIHFVTPDDFAQQLAYMSRPAGYVIEPHIHSTAPRTVQSTQEVLLIRSGKLRVDFFSSTGDQFGSRQLHQGDVILLTAGGHGFHVVEDVEMIEVKQGPYDAGNTRKLSF